jgi:hypothetical protein
MYARRRVRSYRTLFDTSQSGLKKCASRVFARGAMGSHPTSNPISNQRNRRAELEEVPPFRGARGIQRVGGTALRDPKLGLYFFVPGGGAGGGGGFWNCDGWFTLPLTEPYGEVITGRDPVVVDLPN